MSNDKDCRVSVLSLAFEYKESTRNRRQMYCGIRDAEWKAEEWQARSRCSETATKTR